MSSIMLMTLKELCKNCASLARFLYFILFWCKVEKFLHNSCARVLFYSFYCTWANRLTGPRSALTTHIYYGLGTLFLLENGAKLYITRPYTAPPATTHVITLTQTVTLLFIQTVTVLRCISYRSWNVNFHPKCNEQDVPLIIVTQKSKCMKVI